MAVIPASDVPALDASYKPIRTLAAGPGGTTELVRGPAGDVLVRKIIPLELANVHAWMELTRIESPLLPQVQALYQRDQDNALAVVLTYVDGLTLEELVTSTGPIEAPTAVRYLGELCQAVDVLHAHGIIHRDLSPGNIVVAGGSARIIDLGNARVHEDGARKDTTTLGTYGFAAPEQFGFAQTDARSDVYSLGSLLGYLLTGLRPDDPGFDAALADAFRVPANLRIVVERARAFEPSQRYQSAGELAAAAQGLVTPFVMPQARAAWRPPVMRRQGADGLAWDDVGFLRGLALIGNGVIWALMAVIFLWLGFNQTDAIEMFGHVGYGLVGISGAIASVAFGYQVHLALLHRGRYSVAKSRIWRLILQLVLITVVYVVFITVVASITRVGT